MDKPKYPLFFIFVKTLIPDSMRKIFFCLWCLFLILDVSFAQPAIQWQKCFGGTGWDDAYSVQQTTDGGYIVVGSTSSNDGDVTGNHGAFDFWIVRLKNSGTIQWHKCLGGTLNDGATSVQETSDGGYIVEGYTGSNDGDVTGNHDTTGYSDYWLVKLDGSGIIQWQKCLGGTDEDQSYSVQQTSDGGYIVAGYAGSNDGDVTGNHYAGIGDYWIEKLDCTGKIHCHQCTGVTDWDGAYSVQQTIDGGYIVAGFSLFYY